MIFYKEYSNYGNTFCWSYIFEPDDTQYIKDYIQENAPEILNGDGSGTITIPFYNPHLDDDCEIEITITDFL